MVQTIKGSARPKGRLVGFQNGSIPPRDPAHAPRAEVLKTGLRPQVARVGMKNDTCYLFSPGRVVSNRCRVVGELDE